MFSWIPVGWRARRGAVVALGCAIALTASAAFAGAAAAKTRTSNSKTFLLPASVTKTFDVGYPFALKFKNAKYSCAAKVFGLGREHVKILSRGSAQGGTVCRVRVRNNAPIPSIDTTARVRVTAATTY
jgi:hypothetical protein